MPRPKAKTHYLKPGQRVTMCGRPNTGNFPVTLHGEVTCRKCCEAMRLAYRVRHGRMSARPLGRALGKARELGMAYGGQQIPKDRDPYLHLASIMQNMPDFVADKEREFTATGRYRKDYSPPIHQIPMRDYIRQLHAAGQWERDHYEKLRAEGWQWDERGFWWHFWKPGTIIYPG